MKKGSSSAHQRRFFIFHIEIGTEIKLQTTIDCVNTRASLWWDLHMLETKDSQFRESESRELKLIV